MTELNSGGGGTTGDPAELYKTYIVPPGATADDWVEVALDAYANSAGWASTVRDDTNHIVIVYGATMANISGVEFQFRPMPDQIGPVTMPPEDDVHPPDPVPVDSLPVDPIPDPLPTRQGRITVAALRVRSEPRIAADTLVYAGTQTVTLKRDEVFYIIDKANGWYQIVWDNARGYNYIGAGSQYSVEL